MTLFGSIPATDATLEGYIDWLEEIEKQGLVKNLVLAIDTLGHAEGHLERARMCGPYYRRIFVSIEKGCQNWFVLAEPSLKSCDRDLDSVRKELSEAIIRPSSECFAMIDDGPSAGTTPKEVYAWLKRCEENDIVYETLLQIKAARNAVEAFSTLETSEALAEISERNALRMRDVVLLAIEWELRVSRSRK